MQLIYLKPTSTSKYVVYIWELKNTARRNCPVMCLQHLPWYPPHFGSEYDRTLVTVGGIYKYPICHLLTPGCRQVHL